MFGISFYGRIFGFVGMGVIVFVLVMKWVGVMDGKVIGYDFYCNESVWIVFLSDKVCCVLLLEDMFEVVDVVLIYVFLIDIMRNMIFGF